MVKGLFIPGLTAEMFRNGCLESIEALMAEGEIYDIEYDIPKKGRAELKQCPFCGGTAALIKEKDGYTIKQVVHIKNTFYVKCRKCGIEGKTYQSDIWEDFGIVHVEHNGAEEAIEAWNRREGDRIPISPLLDERRKHG